MIQLTHLKYIDKTKLEEEMNGSTDQNLYIAKMLNMPCRGWMDIHQESFV